MGNATPQIAVGLEKLRSDPSILIYDVNSVEYERAPGGLSSLGRMGGAEGGQPPPNARPFASLALSEGVTAVAWKTNVPHVLVYGTVSFTWLRGDKGGGGNLHGLSESHSPPPYLC